ncbi:MAG: O-antigen ligase family protein [Bacteroidetes bacterium]|nr:O-antigen ligase family protein [Bacteroidota bacterium]
MNIKDDKGLIGSIITVLYLMVHFVSDFGGADVMGAQWLYTSTLDLVVLLYLFLNRNTYKEALTSIFNYKFTLLFSLLVLWAIGSYFYAINPTETLVTLARLISTYLLFIQVSILFYKKDIKYIFNIVCFAISFILLVDSFYILKGFSRNIETMDLDANILSLSGNHGNKNVMAASLLIKFPFVLWLIINHKSFIKIINIGVLFFGVVALFILNTRSTYVGLGIIFLIYSISTILFIGINNKIKAALQVAYFLGPILIGLFVANLLLANAVELQGYQGGYGTVTKRAGDITIQSEQGSRIHLWKSAIDYAIKHPFVGAGYGNWKLASIPYEKEFTNDLFVPYHCHNDFIEMFADLGVVGGITFGFMFLLVPIFTIKMWRKSEFKPYHLTATISFMAVTCYAVDAFLNFPAERTAMQTILAVSAAFVFLPISHICKTKTSSGILNKTVPVIFYFISLLLIIPSIYIAKQTYDSLKIQKYVMGEIDTDPKMALEEVKSSFPAIPNLSTSTLPIKGLIARYEFRDKHYEEALRLLNESENDNPYLHYNDFIRTAVYADKQKFDSVAIYAKRAFYNWPRATSYYKNIMFSSTKNEDTIEIKKAYNLYKKYRPGAVANAQYLLALYEVKGTIDYNMMNLLDSTNARYPMDSAILATVNSIFSRNKSGIKSTDVLTNLLNNGVAAFTKRQYMKAAQFYLQAAQLDPTNYTHYENAGISYYSGGEFVKAIPYFEKAVQFSNATTGKSEFFMAMSYIALGKKKQICTPLITAKRKGYTVVDSYLRQYCK